MSGEYGLIRTRRSWLFLAHSYTAYILKEFSSFM